MEKILGIDLGTNSIGLSVRNPELGSTLPEQLEYYCSYIFSSGVGKEKGNEYSYASQRTKFRSQRHLHRTRRYRLWRTLEVLIEVGCCPLSIEDLDKWRIYDKSKGLHREYPIRNLLFEQWIRLDFNGDGIPDYSSPFQLREELATEQMDMTDSISRYKLGRGLYHIAQHRGFKSSKGETLQSQEAEDRGEADTLTELKKSEIEKSKGLAEYMNEYGCATVGCAFARMEREGIRIRANSTYQVVRSMHEDEIRHIFEFQHQLDFNSAFYRQLISRTKGEGSIFYKQPLRSQKGNVGKCTLEPTKSRCPISRPEFEIFRAWSVLNNIKYKSDNGEWLSLPLPERKLVYNELFFLSKTSITIEDIQKKILQNTDLHIQELNYPLKTKLKTCPVARCLRNLLGEQWQTNTLNGYNYEELWHICYEADELDDVRDFVAKYLNGDQDICKRMERLWGCIGQGYAMLSLKAINLINIFLLKGYIYSDAVLLAKLPDIFGEELWQEFETVVLSDFENIKLVHQQKHTIAKITNNLIAAYKAQNTEDTFAYKDYSYTLDASDKKNVRTYCIDTLSKASWDELPHEEQENLLYEVETAYQAFFHDQQREYIPVPKLTDSLREYILSNFSSILDEHACRKLKYLYHPSNISIYKPAKLQKIDVNGHKLSKRLLGSPDVGVFKNPVAMRALYVLRKHINELIANGVIDEDYTRVVVELARDMNDANMRKAIEIYQNKRQEENREIARLIAEYYPDRQVTADDVYKVRLMFEQPCDSDSISQSKATACKDEKLTYKDAQFQKLVMKYSLLKEQNFQCLYTGKMINMANLFSDNKFEMEHTIPRSISFDDSLANQTICDVHFNRQIKKNQIPTQLADYEQIKLRIQPWIDKVKMLRERVRFWKDATKFAATKELKDARIQQMHAWKMELDYWERKVNSFTVEADALNLGFRNRQLVDTRVISKYGYHFLRSVFSHVDVQRGETTAVFRKVLGIQSMDEIKDRTKHSHHAVDATVLTLIPPANKRDAMLKLYYDIQEAEKGLNGLSVERLKHQLQNEVATCSIKGTSRVVPLIEENILINHIAQDKALTPARRKERIHGKVIKYMDENGKLTPKVINTGDSIRGNIHLQSWYGAVKLPLINKEGKPMRDEQGNFLYDKQPVRYVKRVSLDELANTKKIDWSKLKEAIVNKHLYHMMHAQYPNLSFKEACREGLYMLDKHGNRINQIRHIRCYAPTNAHIVPIKEQTYLSNKIYKQDFLADIGDMYAMVRYENEKGKALYRTFSLYEISKSGSMELPSQYVEKGCIWKLKHVLKKGMKVLLFEHNRDELTALSKAQYSKRLYIIQGFESDKRITLLHHLCAKPDVQREPIQTFDALPEKIRCSVNQINYLIEGIDFVQNVKGIKIK